MSSGASAQTEPRDAKCAIADQIAREVLGPGIKVLSRRADVWGYETRVIHRAGEDKYYVVVPWTENEPAGSIRRKFEALKDRFYEEVSRG